MSDWLFDRDAVLLDKEGYWWHVRDRYVDVDTGDRQYGLEDATWTAYERDDAEYIEEQYESDGWKTDTKPAHERGYRVNGSLCGPSSIDFWRGGACVSDHDCAHCGETTQGAADIIISLEDRERAAAWIECGACDDVTELFGEPEVLDSGE